MSRRSARRRIGPSSGQYHQITFEEYAATPIPTPYNDFIKAAPTVEIQSAFVKHYAKFRGYRDGEPGQFAKIMVSISGGADSDRLLDLIERIGYPPGTVTYTYFNTGMEYRATIRHIEALERQYGVTIRKKNAACPVPVAVKKYGYLFYPSKSANIYTGCKSTVLPGKIRIFKHSTPNTRNVKPPCGGGAMSGAKTAR